jgi:hypothetical protein
VRCGKGTLLGRPRAGNGVEKGVMSRRLLWIAVIALVIAEILKQNYYKFASVTRGIYFDSSHFFGGSYATISEDVDRIAQVWKAILSDVADFLKNSYLAIRTDIDYLLTHHEAAVIAALALLVILRLALSLWRLHMRTIEIASNFYLAEAELNSLIKTFRAHKGRLGRAKERAEWYRDIAKKEPPLFNLGDPFPETISDKLIGTNEDEIQSKRKKKNDCVLTAFLLSQLYRSAPQASLTKIETERRTGKEPYVAAGIEYLSNQHWRLLRFVVWKWGFPKGLVLKDGDNYIYNWDVIKTLTEE